MRYWVVELSGVQRSGSIALTPTGCRARTVGTQEGEKGSIEHVVAGS